MSEPIRYAFGERSLGRFVAATSGAGVVIFEFGDNEADLLKLLAIRFPGARIERNDVGLQDIVRKLEHLVDHAEEDPGITLYPRVDAYQKQV